MHQACCCLQVHDQRNTMVPEEEGGNEVWLDGSAQSSPDPDLGTKARNMIQGQRQYYDMVHVIKEQASLDNAA